MKTRIITAIVGSAIVIPCLIFMHTPVFPLFWGVVSCFAVYEIIKATGGHNHVVSVISCLTAFVIPFLFHYSVELPLMPVVCVYVMMYFIIMVIMHKQTTFSDIITAIFASIVIPCSFSSMIKIRDIITDYPDKYTQSNVWFFFLFAFFCSWITDAFAYFVGRSLGKHKLCPNISPKKTVEGAVGGVLGALLLNIIMFVIFEKCIFVMHTVKVWQIIIISIILSVISMFGDLSASIIKRNHNIKDFGNILPGHGGVMDRFDSCLFVFPALYIAIILIS